MRDLVDELEHRVSVVSSFPVSLAVDVFDFARTTDLLQLAASSKSARPVSCDAKFTSSAFNVSDTLAEWAYVALESPFEQQAAGRNQRRHAGCTSPAKQEEVQMKVALLALALIGTPLMTPISDRVPGLSVEALCKSRSADDKAMRLPESQSVADCVRDETTAKQKLSTVWGATSRPVRDRCKAEVLFSLNTRSYLDLLSCIQIADDTKSISFVSKSKSKNRNAK